MKKWLAILMVLMVSMALLTGCKSEEEKNKEKAKQATEQFFERSEDKKQ